MAEFRARGGQVGGYHASMQLLLLTTTGARTGQRRAVPLTYVPDGDRYIITAGNAGSDRHPAWYYNLLANPEATVEVGRESFATVAVIADGAEREPLYDLASLTLGHQERLADVIAGYGADVDLEAIRGGWSLRSLRASRWLIEHGFDPNSPGAEFDVLRTAAGQ